MQTEAPADRHGTTTDAFHRGAFHLVQPAARGHRAGMDALIVAAAVPSGFSGHVVDLGAGAGAAGLAVAARCRQARVTLVERSPEMLGCARQSLELAANRALASRVSLLEADISSAGTERAASGLGDRMFDFAIMNPPFNPPEDRATPDPLKRLAHVMADDLFESWLRTAAAILQPRGGLALVARPASLPAILAALARRFGDVEIMPVHPREDAAAIRLVIRARCGARGGLVVNPSFVLHGPEGAFTARAAAINDGAGSLFGD